VRNEAGRPTSRHSSGTKLKLEPAGAGAGWLELEPAGAGAGGNWSWLEPELMKPRLTAGTSVQLKGRLEKSKGGGQAVELIVDETSVLGECDPEVSNLQVNRPTRPIRPTPPTRLNAQGVGGDSEVVIVPGRFSMW
jgi:hypothetical protein